MEKMYVSMESYNTGAAQSGFAASEPAQSKVAIASYRCKLYRAQLDQGNARQDLAPQLKSRLATAGKTRLVPAVVH